MPTLATDMPTVIILLPGGEFHEIPLASIEHLLPVPQPRYFTYQVAVRTGRPARKGRPYPGGTTERDESGYYHGPEDHVTLSYRSELDLDRGDEVLVPLGDHHRPRKGLVLGRETGYQGELREILKIYEPDLDAAFV